MPGEAFPETHWGRDQQSPLFKPVFKFASTALGSRFIKMLVPWDQRLLKATNGRYTLFGPTSMPDVPGVPDAHRPRVAGVRADPTLRSP
jgi:hypothetical protein